MTRRRILWLSLALAVISAALPPVAQAGPPLICHPFNIGDAKSLPWGGSDWSAIKADYDVRRLVGDTLALLAPDTPVLVRMETLRRATIYVRKNQPLADELLARLMERVRDAEGRGQAAATAWFDAGYLAESYKQTGLSTSLNGYALVKKSIGLGGEKPEKEFAAALMAAGRQGQSGEHLQNARAGAGEGSLLAKNLLSHFGQQGK